MRLVDIIEIVNKRDKDFSVEWAKELLKEGSVEKAWNKSHICHKIFSSSYQCYLPMYAKINTIPPTLFTKEALWALANEGVILVKEIKLINRQSVFGEDKELSATYDIDQEAWDNYTSNKEEEG